MNSPYYKLRSPQKSRGVYARCVKRCVDVCCALVALLLLSPLLVVIMLLLVLVQPGNPFFVQKRIGRHCKPFDIIKFRTMTCERDASGELLPDEERTTWVGRFLRATSLDELPELLNVLRGDMSFIGPRPWIPEQMATFKPTTRQRRMLVPPGMSGLAQIHGRNDLTFRQRVCYDLCYIRNLSLWLDVQILICTLYKVLCREGIIQRADALERTAPPLAPKDPATKGLRGNAPGSKPAVSL